MYYATLTRRKWLCDNATMYQCVTVTFTQWKNHSHKHGYHQERNNENKNWKNEEKEEEEQQQQQPRGRRRRQRQNQPMKGQWRDKNKLNTPTRFNASWVSKNKPKPKLWNQECDKKELTHLNIKTIIAITTWTKMGAHSKSWIMTHDAKITGNKKYNSQCQSWLEARKVWGW